MNYFISVSQGSLEQLFTIKSLQMKHNTDCFPYSSADSQNVFDKALRDLIDKMKANIEHKEYIDKTFGISKWIHVVGKEINSMDEIIDNLEQKIKIKNKSSDISEMFHTLQQCLTDLEGYLEYLKKKN